MSNNPQRPNFANPERPSFASPCDLDELKHQVREKAVAELKEYIEKGGEWHDFYGTVTSGCRHGKWRVGTYTFSPEPATFKIDRHTAKSVTHDAAAFSLFYKGTEVYTVVTVSSVSEDVQKERAAAQKKHKAAERKLPEKERSRWLPYGGTLPDPTPEDAHSEWFVSLYDELHKRIILAEQCKKWEALLHDKPEEKEEALGRIVEYPKSKSSKVDTPLWVILGGLCLLTLIVGAMML